jgi:hypothetical protein
VITLEVGITAGVILSLSGLGLLLWAVHYWKELGFGPMSYPEGLRLVIPAVTILTLGVQIIFLSFFLSVLGMRRK